MFGQCTGLLDLIGRYVLRLVVVWNFDIMRIPSDDCPNVEIAMLDSFLMLLGSHNGPKDYVRNFTLFPVSSVTCPVNAACLLYHNNSLCLFNIFLQEPSQHYIYLRLGSNTPAHPPLTKKNLHYMTKIKINK